MENVSLSSEKPRLSFWQIWNMSIGFLGIQFGFALQNANTSRIFETLGGDTKNLAFYWLAAPVTGLLVQPLIGYYSDRTWHPKWGRRRPFFAIGAILATLALIIMPNSPTLWVAIGMLWIMDASINISMEPFRAFVGDMLPASQRTRGFAMQSFFIGVGAVVASILPWVFTNWIGISNTTEDGEGIPPSVKWSFYVGAFAFLTAVMWTVFTTKEYPPDEDEVHEEDSNAPLIIKYAPNTYLKIGLGLLGLALLITLWFAYQGLDPQLYVLCGIIAVFGVCYTFASQLMSRNKYRNGFVQIVRDFQNMPKTMIQLAFVQFFSWFALFAMWIYTTSGITSHIYDMNMEADNLAVIEQSLSTYGAKIDDPKEQEKYDDILEELKGYQTAVSNGAEKVTLNVNFTKYFLDNDRDFNLPAPVYSTLGKIQKEYNDGADWVGILFAGYNGVAAIAALLITFLAKLTSRRVTHLIALSCGGIGLISFYFIQDPNFLVISMIGVGIAWASILSIPYAMLSSSLPAQKMGYYMGIFNFFIVIPQIVAASVLGFIISTFFDSEFIFALVLGGGSMVLAGLLSLMVDDKDEVMMKENIS